MRKDRISRIDAASMLLASDDDDCQSRRPRLGAIVSNHRPKLCAWGKYDKEDGTFHRLEHHCADVAACFEALLAEPVLRDRYSMASGERGGLSLVTASRLTVVAFLHDFAKLNTGFQFKVRDPQDLPPNPPPNMGHIAEAFYCAEQPDIRRRLGLDQMLEDWGEGLDALLLGALSHHGRPPRLPHTGIGPIEIWQSFAGYDPGAAADLLRKRARTWFPKAFDHGPQLPTCAALAHLFAGTVALADQIGSDRERHFPFEPNEDSEYIHRARRQARAAIRARGLQREPWLAQAASPDFRTMFGHEAPRPLQFAVERAPLEAPLMILESETGSGKTEAAMMRFVSLWRAGLVDGLYFAVPTRAAAKQLHERVDRAHAHDSTRALGEGNGTRGAGILRGRRGDRQTQRRLRSLLGGSTRRG